ncbi:MAG: FliA/WhiG family polymerase sigma factor, partial [Rhizobacter sp.]|nr:FliA/WhiG family polymerase sigma factor [Rhizobacter sp.]
MHAGYAELRSAANAAQGALDEQQQLLSYAPLVKRIVRQLNSQVSVTMGRDDMEQIGLMGLLDALRRYGPPDEKFGAYAAMRIRGAVLDELRRQDWRPRSVRQESHRLRDEVRALTRKLGREPVDAEIAAELGLTHDQFQQYQLDENAEELASFDELVHEMSQVPSDQRSPEEQMIARRSIEQALHALDAREQRVIQLYYEFELSLKEIAAVLDLTEARICQINKAALKKMKT